jgi:hypothetical protein
MRAYHLPQGPFGSTEAGTGYMFGSVRVGWCMQNASSWEAQNFKISRDPEGHSWGVASVECSISGKFFAALPCVELCAGPRRFNAEAPTAEIPAGGRITQ